MDFEWVGILKIVTIFPAAHGRDWVDLNKRGGIDRVFRGLAGLLPRVFPRAKPKENHRDLRGETLILVAQ